MTPTPVDLPLGVGGDDAGVVHVDLGASPRWLVVGPPGSGRSTTLVTLGQAACARGRAVVVLGSPRSPAVVWATGAGAAAPPPGDARAVEGALSGARTLVLVDDLERLLGTPTEDLLVQHLEEATDGWALAASSTAADLLAAYRGLPVLLRRARTGVLLHPLSPGDGELLGVRLPRTASAAHGRATLVVDGRASTLQVAAPASVGSPGEQRSGGRWDGGRPVGGWARERARVAGATG